MSYYFCFRLKNAKILVESLNQVFLNALMIMLGAHKHLQGLSQCSQWTKNVDMIERLETMEELMSRVEQEQKSQKRGK